MTLSDDNGPDTGGDDIVAAEYVVGVLPAQERRAVAERIERDAAFARLVESWEARLSPLATAYPAAEPPAAVKAAIDRRLFASSATAPAAAASGGLWSSLAFWRGLASAAVVALAVYAGSNLLVEPPAPPTAERLVASLTADGSDVRFLAMYDPAEGEIALSKLAGDPGPERTFELWMIEGQNPAVSMGVVPAGVTSRLGVDDELRAKLAAGAVLAISLEPEGGSPTGQATGPIVAAGDLHDI